MRRGAVRVAANVGGLRITVMASRAGLFILSRRIQFVLVTVALVRMRVCGYDDRFRNVGFYAPRPCYNAGWWWVPEDQQKYTAPTGGAVAMQ